MNLPTPQSEPNPEGSLPAANLPPRQECEGLVAAMLADYHAIPADDTAAQAEYLLRGIVSAALELRKNRRAKLEASLALYLAVDRKTYESAVLVGGTTHPDEASFLRAAAAEYGLGPSWGRVLELVRVGRLLCELHRNGLGCSLDFAVLLRLLALPLSAAVELVRQGLATGGGTIDEGDLCHRAALLAGSNEAQTAEWLHSTHCLIVALRRTCADETQPLADLAPALAALRKRLCEGARPAAVTPPTSADWILRSPTPRTLALSFSPTISPTLRTAICDLATARGWHPAISSPHVLEYALSTVQRLATREQETQYVFLGRVSTALHGKPPPV